MHFSCVKSAWLCHILKLWGYSYYFSLSFSSREFKKLNLWSSLAECSFCSPCLLKMFLERSVMSNSSSSRQERSSRGGPPLRARSAWEEAKEDRGEKVHFAIQALNGPSFLKSDLVGKAAQPSSSAAPSSCTHGIHRGTITCSPNTSGSDICWVLFHSSDINPIHQLFCQLPLSSLRGDCSFGGSEYGLILAPDLSTLSSDWIPPLSPPSSCAPLFLPPNISLLFSICRILELYFSL